MKQQKEQDKKKNQAEKEAKAREEQKQQKLKEKMVKQYEKQYLQRKRNPDSSSDSSVNMSDLSDGSGMDLEVHARQCYVCEAAYDDSPVWVTCSQCPHMFHRRCVKSIDLCSCTED